MFYASAVIIHYIKKMNIINNAKLNLTPEERMNLTALKRRDPYIRRILDTASQVALYIFNEPEDAWAKSEIEGTLFVYERSAAPLYGFTISNRKMPKNHWETINGHVEFQQQDPFLLYKNRDDIYGLWFFEKKECRRIGDLVVRLTKMVQKEPVEESSGAPLEACQVDSSGDKHGVMKEILKDPLSSHGENNDIMALLSKAQREYDKEHPQYEVSTGLSISVSSLFANARNQKQDEPKLDSHVRAVSVLPVKIDEPKETCDSVEKSDETKDVLQSFVRKMKIRGIQSLDRNVGPLLSTQVSSGSLKNDLNYPNSLSMISEDGLSPENVPGPLTPISPSYGNNKNEISPSNLPSRNSVPSYSPPPSQALPAVPSHFSCGDVSLIVNVNEGSPPSSPEAGGIVGGGVSLLTPDAFETVESGRKAGKARPVVFFCPSEDPNEPSSSGAEMDPESLTKEQLKSTLLFLLKTDEGFVDVLHRGYVNSLTNQRRKVNK